MKISFLFFFFNKKRFSVFFYIWFRFSWSLSDWFFLKMELIYSCRNIYHKENTHTDTHTLYVYVYIYITSKQHLCKYNSIDAHHGRWKYAERKSQMASEQECCEVQILKETPHEPTAMQPLISYLWNHTSKDRHDTQATTGEARIFSYVTFSYWSFYMYVSALVDQEELT